MEKQQALALIEQALNIATQKGAFTIAEIEVILEAYKALKPIGTQVESVQSEA